jgi:hypothetical protein
VNPKVRQITMKMLDTIAARLQSFVVVVCLFLGALASMVFFAFTASPTISFSPFVPMFGMTACWGFLAVAYLFAPGRGPLSPEVLAQKMGLWGFHGRCMRFVAPPFLLLFILSPLLAWIAKVVQQ